MWQILKGKPRGIVKSAEALAFLFVCITVYAGIFTPLLVHIRQTPPGTQYTLAEGFFLDYYQYISWIKSGTDGNILHINRYTQEVGSPSFIHVFFPLLGLVTKPFGISPPIAFQMTRIVTLALFLLSFALLVKTLFPHVWQRVASMLFLLSQTGIWTVRWAGQKPELVEPVPWVGTINAHGKFNLPPHHLAALACCLGILTVLAANRHSIRRNLILAGLSAALSFLNPSVALIFFLALAGATGVEFLFARKLTGESLRTLIPIFAPAVPILAYHSWVFTHIMPWSWMYTLMRAFNPPTRFVDFLMALGPLMVLAAFSLVDKPFVTTRVGRVLILWIAIPVGLFPLVGKLPINYGRLFQAYQYVPIALAATAGLYVLARWTLRVGIPLRATVGTLLILSLSYAAYPFVHAANTQVHALQPNWYNVYVPVSAVNAFAFLDKETPRDSVVLAGEFASMMIPAFTHNRVILGRDDTARDYYTKREGVGAFFGGKLPPQEARHVLSSYSVSYVLFGFDAPAAGDIAASSPITTEVFRDGTVSVARILPSHE